MRALHWLPVEYHITYKLCLLMHHIHNGKAPVYLADILTATSDMESRSGLRSASSARYEIPRSRLRLRERRFAVAGPRAWNSLPACLHRIRSTLTFKRHLKLIPASVILLFLVSLFCMTFNCSLLVMVYASRLL